ncbi:MAG: DUF2723 domain-containing protein [Flavisolibacter sp.]
MNFRKVNNIWGWIICGIASLVYILTAEKAGSLWDCGEFVSSCFKVQLPHPPGAPLFILLGRLAIIFSGSDPSSAAKAVNILNALASGFTIMFLFWTITHFARKLMTELKEEPNLQQAYTIIGAGVVGALAYTFTDSFWYSAVEGEVYAFSSFFTALIFWAMLKWERADDLAGSDRGARNRADRWIIFIAFAMGLSIGVHLLGLLTIPAIVMVYYYKRYTYSRNGAILAFILGCVITGIVQVAVIQWTVDLAGKFDIFFVNNFHVPFFSGFVFFFLVLGLLIAMGLRWANTKGWSYLRLGLWSFSFMMLGYSVYITTMERSNANPAIDMNKVDNPMSLVYYLGRDQYGSQPIVYGTHFLAQPTDIQEGKTRYVKGKDSYIALPPDREYKYDNKDYQLFPRVWDPSNEQGHADYYINWLNLDVVAARQLSQVTGVGEGVIQTTDQTGKPDSYQLPDNFAPRVQRGQVVKPGAPIAVKIPSYADNLQFFFTYQLGFMYWRYFMWNFSGRQNDLQGGGNKRDGNWITGISFIDNAMLGDQSKLPDSIKNNKAHNSLYLLPFLLGMLGCVYQFMHNRKDWVISFLLFFFTGIAIVLYLNQAGNQPRERDYAFAGAFYAYAIWIGLAVVAIVRLAREQIPKISFNNTLLYGSILTFAVAFMSSIYGAKGAAISGSLLIAIAYSVLSAALIYLVRTVAKSNLRNAGLIATSLCLVAPIIMAAQEWDDHDRSKKTLAPDVAKDYLNSCPQNAVLFTFGDNDTYPLWYAQEVEGVRPDIRIINTSLLGIDWYVNELRHKINESAPIDVVWNEDQIRGLSYLGFKPEEKPNQPQLLLDVMKNKIGPQLNSEDKSGVTFSQKHFIVPVDTSFVRKTGVVTPTDSLTPQIQLDLADGKSYLSLDQLTMLNIVAANNWKRPICFTSPYGEVGFSPYLRQEGLIFRLVPVRSDGSRTRSMDLVKSEDLLLNKFLGGGADLKGNYFDEENRRHLLSIRSAYAQAAAGLADQNKKAEALKVLDKSESLMKPWNLPYAMVSRGNSHNQISMLYLESAYKAGDQKLSGTLKQSLTKDLNDQKKYYNYLKNYNEEYYAPFVSDEQDCDEFLRILDQWDKVYNSSPATVKETPGQIRTDSSKKNK